MSKGFLEQWTLWVNPAVRSCLPGWLLSARMSRWFDYQPIVTGDGRRLTGSEINYARVLIDRANEACKQSHRAEALASVQEAQTLLHPAPRRMRGLV